MQRHKQRHPFNKERLAVAAEAGCVQYLCTLPDPLREQSSASFIIKWPWLMKPVLFSCTEKCTAWPGEMTFSLHSNERSATEGGTGGAGEGALCWMEGAHSDNDLRSRMCTFTNSLGFIWISVTRNVDAFSSFPSNAPQTTSTPMQRLFLKLWPVFLSPTNWAFRGKRWKSWF